MINVRLSSLSKYLKRTFLGLGVLVILFLIANVALGFSPELLGNLRRSPFGARAFSFAEYVRFSREPSIQPQVEVVSWEYKVFGENGKEINPKKISWDSPFAVYAAVGGGGRYFLGEGDPGNFTSGIKAVLKNTGTVPVHGLNVRLTLLRDGKIISEVNPFDDVGNTYGSMRDNTDIYAFIPAGGTYSIAPTMSYPPRFDKAELKIEARLYKASQYEGSFELINAGVLGVYKKKWTDVLSPAYQDKSSGMWIDNFYQAAGIENSNRNYPTAYFLEFELKNNSNSIIKNIRVDGSFWLTGKVWESRNEFGIHYTRLESRFWRIPGVLVGKVGKRESVDSWVSEEDRYELLPFEYLTLKPGKSARLFKFLGTVGVGDDDNTDPLYDLKLIKTHYIYAWGEKAE